MLCICKKLPTQPRAFPGGATLIAVAVEDHAGKTTQVFLLEKHLREEEGKHYFPVNVRRDTETNDTVDIIIQYRTAGPHMITIPKSHLMGYVKHQ